MQTTAFKVQAISLYSVSVRGCIKYTNGLEALRTEILKTLTSEACHRRSKRRKKTSISSRMGFS